MDIADELARGAIAKKFTNEKRRRGLADAVAAWLDAARDGDTDVNFGLGCLAAIHVLHELGQHLDPEQGWALLDFLVASAEEAAPWAIDVDGPAGGALAQQLIAGELPITLAYFLPEMAPLAALASAGREQLSEGLAELPGVDGHIRAGHLEVLLPLVACWTRSRAMMGEYTGGPWTRNAQRRFHAVVRQALRWTAADGSLLLSPREGPKWTPAFLRAALLHGGRKADAAAARKLLRRTAKFRSLPSAKAKPPKPATFSENASLALLRTEWSPCATTVAVDFSALGMRLDIAARGRRLFEGVWATSSVVDGKPLHAAGDWEEVCWFTDRDVDYIEFRLPLEDGARIERQVLLARKDEFLWLADHLQNPAPAELQHTWRLPLAAQVAWSGAAETREAVLRADAAAARLLPLALPEWRIDPRVGELSHVDGAVQLDERTVGRALACPLFIDLKPGRLAKPCTWRQLTVAESLKIQPPDVAVGYRVQCGRKQWLIYRSQGPRGNRTLLGQNTSNEFLAARFLAPSGGIEELIEVQG